MALMTPHLPETCSNYYELLGLSAFAADIPVIDARAKELMREARKYQVGRYSSQAEKYLNLLAEARGCLLNAARKAEYDEELRRKWEMPPVSVPTTYQFQLSETQRNPFPDFGEEESPLRSRALVAKARRNRLLLLLIVLPGTILLCAVLGVFGVWILASRAAGGALPLDEALRQVLSSKGTDGGTENQPGEK